MAWDGAGVGAAGGLSEGCFDEARGGSCADALGQHSPIHASTATRQRLEREGDVALLTVEYELLLRDRLDREVVDRIAHMQEVELFGLRILDDRFRFLAGDDAQ